MTGPVTGPSGDRDPPRLRVVSGDPTPEELAALVVVLSALAAAGETASAHPRAEWSAPYRRVRRSAVTGPSHGPGGWRASSLPH